MSAFSFLIRVYLHGRLAALDWAGRKFPVAGRVRIGSRRGVFLNTPQLVEEVLVQRADEFRKGPALRVYSRPLLGNGLLTSESDDHRKHRRLVAPAFAHHRVPRYADVMSQLTKEACSAWPETGIVAMHREMTRLTLAIVGRTLFDVDLLEDADEIGKHITTLIQFATAKTRSLIPFPYEWPTPANRRARRAVDGLNATVYSLIERRRASGEDKGDLLSMLLLSRDEDGNTLSDEEVRDEAMTLFVAGHETTANAATWSLYMLARQTELQDALRRQIQGAVGSRSITYADLPKIPLALEVFKETLRLYPPAYIVAREALHDIKLSEIEISKGELLILSEYLVHRNAKYFPDPLRFDPSRFSPENEPRIPKYAYFPFGAGRRVCIGNQFALMEGQILLGTIIQHARISLADERELESDPLMTLRPKGKAKMRVERIRQATRVGEGDFSGDLILRT